MNRECKYVQTIVQPFRYSQYVEESRSSTMYEGESNENIKYFLNTIYCAEVVQNCITFQHNLPHAQCKSSSVYKLHKFL